MGDVSVSRPLGRPIEPTPEESPGSPEGSPRPPEEAAELPGAAVVVTETMLVTVTVGVPMTTNGGLVSVGTTVKVVVSVPGNGWVMVWMGRVKGPSRFVGVRIRGRTSSRMSSTRLSTRLRIGSTTGTCLFLRATPSGSCAKKMNVVLPGRYPAVVKRGRPVGAAVIVG